MIGFSFYFAIVQGHYAKKIGTEPSIDVFFFGYAVFIGFCLAAFVSLFLGVEYSDGVIRNKLMVGHSRVSIYLSNLAIAVTAGMIIIVTYMCAMLIIGTPFLGFFKAPAWDLLRFFIASILVTVVFAAIYIFVVMVFTNKAIVVTICLFISFILLGIALDVGQKLAAPEFYEGYFVEVPNESNDSITISGDTNIGMKKIENPFYLRGKKREWYQFVFDFIPMGQGLQIANMEKEANLLQMQLYSLGITIVMTGTGMVIFRKKDIK